MRLFLLVICVLLFTACSSRTRIIYNDDIKLNEHEAFNVRGLRVEPTFGSANPVSAEEQLLLSKLTELLSARGYK